MNELMGKLNLMDCMEGMKRFPDKYFELAIVDPPYGIKRFERDSIMKMANDKTVWNKKTTHKNYFKELKRISKNQMVWGGNNFSLESTRCFIVWDKGSSLKGRSFSECEYCWTSFDNVSRIYVEDSTRQKKIHPAQKPIALYRWLLQNYAKKGDKILDTHVGSGSSLIACIEEGFEYCGFEIDEDYYNSAQKRIEEIKSQGKLFVAQ